MQATALLRLRHRLPLLLIAVSLGTPLAQAGGVPSTTLETVEVRGVRTLDETPISATEGAVTAEQLAERPISRAGELLEFVPGLMATQHSGEGKANQYFLRGFNLDHGTDFATVVDGMPVNMRSHGHGQGYADINFIIPELIGELEYRKGPYYADVGDFAAAGSADLRYKDSLPAPLASVTLGEYGYRHLLVAASPKLLGGNLLLGATGTLYDDPYALDQAERKTAVLARFNRGTRRSGFTTSLAGYYNQYTATDQVPQRAIDDGRLDRYGFIDPSDGGATHRVSLAAELRGEAADGVSHWSVSGYALDYRLDLFSNFTYFLDDPENGDQFEQFDRRQVYGGEARKHWRLPFAIPADVEVGVQGRYDDIDQVGLYKTVARRRLSTTREDAVKEASVALFVESHQRWLPKFRSTVGARVDSYYFDVESDLAANSGSTDATIVTPKLSLAFGPWAKTDYFVNFGYGFHSNDARGTVIAVDPADGETPLAPVSPLARARGLDVGFTTALVPNVKLAVSVFSLRLASELVYIGDAGNSEASGASRRSGVEVAAFYTPLSWLTLDADYAFSRARLDSADGERIPNALDYVAAFGITVPERAETRGFSGGLRLRHLGPGALIEDNSARSSNTTLVNAQLGYRLHPRLSASLAVLNVFNSRENDITYFYTSRLPGEAEEGVDDFHLHPVEKRMVRFTITGTL